MKFKCQSEDWVKGKVNRFPVLHDFCITIKKAPCPNFHQHHLPCGEYRQHEKMASNFQTYWHFQTADC